MAPCAGALDQDDDGDGVSEDQGDCDDCRADIGPASMELPGDEVDDNCDNSLDVNLMSCDTGLTTASQDPMEAAKAIGLCKPATEGWGLVNAKWVLPDGAPWDLVGAPLYGAYHVGHGLLPDFGSMMHTQEGQRLLALSTGTARRPLDAGYIPPTGAGKGYATGTPPGYPKAWPSCPGIVGGSANDGVGLEVVLRAPANAHGLHFDFAFYAWDFPDYLCSAYNDYFVALLTPSPPGALDDNICFDTSGNTMSVNADVLNACLAQTANSVFYLCPLGQQLLGGSGFDDAVNGYGVSSGWMRTTSPVEPGKDITLRFAIWDSTDGAFDSTVLVDNVGFEGAATDLATVQIDDPL